MSTNETTNGNNGNNHPTAEDYLRMSEELGKNHGKGGDAQISFALQMIEGGYHGELASDKKKYADGNGDHFRQAAAYMKGRGLAEVFGGKKLNERVMMSKTKTFIDFGGNPKWGMGQPLQGTGQFVAGWKKLKAKSVNGLADLNNALLDFIREQKKQTVMMDAKEMEKFYFLKGAKSVSVDKVLAGLVKTATKLTRGEVPNCNAFDCDEMHDMILAGQNALKVALQNKGKTV